MFLGSCNTIDGPNPDKPCIFPFYWRGKTYNGKLLGIDRKFDLAELWPNFGRTSAELRPNFLTNIRCRSFRQRELPNFETFRNFFSLKRAKISSENTIMEIQYSKNTISIVFPQFYFHYIVSPHSENTSSVLQNFRRSF